MAGTKMGSIKKKMGLRGKTKPGEMISKMNKMKMDAMKEGESLKHEKSESASFEKKESKGLVKDKADKGIKKTGAFKGKSNKLGGGGRFAQVVAKVSGKKGVYNPKGLAAYIGRKSLGKAKFQKLAAKGKKHNG